MSGINLGTFFDTLRKLYRKDETLKKIDFDEEKKKLEEILTALNKTILSELYDFSNLKPIGAGGAGIVIRIKDKRLGYNRALKIPRPDIEIQEILFDSVKTEMKLLTELVNENLINIHTSDHISIPIFKFPYPYYVMDFIGGKHITLDDRISKKLDEDSSSKNARKIIDWLVKRLHEVSLAIRYLHSHNIIHFDVKPSNILIGENDRAILSDLGYAKKKIRSSKEVLIACTEYYAHPFIIKHRKTSTNPFRIRADLSPNQFKKVFDIYAFGKSILEILDNICNEVNHHDIYDYNFVYLHLMACRMLDGKNKENDLNEDFNGNDVRPLIKETWLDLDKSDFGYLKYNTFDEIVDDFEKLLFKDEILLKIPELNAFEPKRIQSSEGIPAPFTKRVKRIVEHPLFARLASIPQLGLISKIYPTATHTRLEHSLGTFRNTCLYINSLYNDSYNPLFKQLVNENSLKSLLVSSLLHDLGHFPFEHEIAEAIKSIKDSNSESFDHHSITLKLLENETPDLDGNPIAEILKNDWMLGDDFKLVKGILCQLLHSKEKKDALIKEYKIPKNQIPVIKMLASIIDSPIDADKLDYLIRDSANCFLNYGKVIDTDRLIRNLTVVITDHSTKPKTFSIGTYEKGKSTAESFAFARYLLYQSVYWHHTSRSIRVMLSEAIQSAYRSNSNNGSNEFVQTFVDEIGTYKVISFENRTDIYRILDLIKENSKDEIEYLDMILNRDYFKRIFTVHHNAKKHENDKEPTLHGDFRYALKINDNFNEDLRECIIQKYEDSKNHTSPILDDKIEKIECYLEKEGSILCDCPNPSKGSKRKLQFIPEPKRIRSNYYKRYEIGKIISDMWESTFDDLMNIVAKGRIFCHPKIRDLLLTTIGEEGLKMCLIKIIDKSIY